MRSILNWGFMKYTWWLMLVVLCLPAAAAEHLGVYEHGTVVRMHSGDCAGAHRGFVATIGGAPAQAVADSCPEYTLVSDKVVFVIVGRSSSQLIPLADVIDFRLLKGELAVRVDDAKHESKFSIKEMVLRSEWDSVQRHIAAELDAPTRSTDAMLVQGR